MRKCVLATAVFSMLAWLASPSGAVTIDSFEDGEFSLTSTSPNGNCGSGIGQSGLTGVIGGCREPGVLIWDQGYTSGSATFALDLTGVGDHGVSLGVPANRTATGGLNYPGDSDEGLGLDLTADGASAFQFAFSQDPGNGSLALNVITSADHWATMSLTGAGTYQIPFSAFNLPEGDLGNVKTLYFEMVYTARSQPITATLANVSTAPEPSTLVLLTIGGLGLLGLARRRWV